MKLNIQKTSIMVSGPITSWQVSEVAQSWPTLWDPMDYTQSLELSRPEHWSGLLFPSPGDLPNLETEPRSPALQVDSLPAEPQGSPWHGMPSWQTDGKTVGAVKGVLFLGSKVTADSDCFKRCSLLGKKAMANLDSIFKNRDITLLTKVCIVKATIFPVVMYGCESWTIKKAECWRIDAFELWCWRRLSRDPWTARSSNQSILKEISPEYSLEGLMLKLKFQYYGHLVWRDDSLEKTLMLGKTEGGRRRGRQRMGWLDGITNSVEERGAWCAVVPEVAKSWTWPHDWPLPTTIRSHLLDCFKNDL